LRHRPMCVNYAKKDCSAITTVVIGRNALWNAYIFDGINIPPICLKRARWVSIYFCLSLPLVAHAHAYKYKYKYSIFIGLWAVG